MSSDGNATGGNIGEWSEVYVFFRLLGEHEICSCDANLNRTNEVFPILKIIRGKLPDSAVFCYYHESTDTWEIKTGKTTSIKIKSSESTSEADDLLALLLENNKHPDRFAKAGKFLQRLSIEAIKAESHKKPDITLQISDVRAGTDPTCGFSIKSYLGQPPTLLNSSGDCTNFLFEVDGISCDDVESINKLDKTKEIMRTIKAMGGRLIFQQCCKDVFAENLELIDTAAEQVLAELLSAHYFENCGTISEATEYVMANNILRLRNPSAYKTLVKRLLDTVALGMTPGTVWDGETDRTSGIIIVKSDGDVVTYHVYNRDAFKQYLYMQTKFERPSRKRHKYGYLFVADGKVYIKLALQIRFR
ncbi:MAG: HpaII family restriction endonuclease [Akkermansiaceae bacterium]|nr:HpaII family restriction endonuclease [Akkermansiaceae bacterium]